MRKAVQVRRAIWSVKSELPLAGAGVMIGLLGALGLARLMAALLYGVSPIDGVTYALAGIVVGVLALTASYWPARRAAGVAPIVAMRSE